MKRPQSADRDQVVADAIERLAVPQPRPGFFEDVRGALAREETRQPRPARLSWAALRRPLPRARPRILLLTAIASALVGGIVGASVSGAAGNRTIPPPVRVSGGGLSFAPARGWNTLAADLTIRADSAPVAWAATTSFEPETDYSGFPDSTVKALPPGGIVISALGPRPVEDDASFPDISVPLEISAGTCATAYEGQPKPYIALCSLDRQIGRDKVLNVLVWIGTEAAGAKPSQALIEAANSELARLAVPR
jgi:hypothetical protein